MNRQFIRLSILLKKSTPRKREDFEAVADTQPGECAV
jgi:hypothetical protein